MASSQNSQLRREIACALGEAQSESSWVEAGIALEVTKQSLRRRLQHITLFAADGVAVAGDQLIQDLLTAS